MYIIYRISIDRSYAEHSHQSADENIDQNVVRGGFFSSFIEMYL